MIEYVVFFVFLILQGAPKPLTFEHKFDTLDECLFEVREILKRPPNDVTTKGGVLQAGCAIKMEPAVKGEATDGKLP